ncbi:hypothetical protein B0T09DRAFT_385615 [Sordaria sp. MPI-SDFR-AT-0083]|nr:hypothetical protein B0T09DRAFT_385615 [Sordaria sp. MPI-SDFR-AT-0083]
MTNVTAPPRRSSPLLGTCQNEKLLLSWFDNELAPVPKGDDKQELLVMDLCLSHNTQRVRDKLNEGIPLKVIPALIPGGLIRLFELLGAANSPNGDFITLRDVKSFADLRSFTPSHSLSASGFSQREIHQRPALFFEGATEHSFPWADPPPSLWATFSPIDLVPGEYHSTAVSETTHISDAHVPATPQGLDLIVKDPLLAKETRHVYWAIMLDKDEEDIDT